MVLVPGLKPGLLRYNARFKAWALRNGTRFKAWALRNGARFKAWALRNGARFKAWALRNSVYQIWCWKITCDSYMQYRIFNEIMHAKMEHDSMKLNLG